MRRRRSTPRIRQPRMRRAPPGDQLVEHGASDVDLDDAPDRDGSLVPAQTPSERPMISFMISVVPP